VRSSRLSRVVVYGHMGHAEYRSIPWRGVRLQEYPNTASIVPSTARIATRIEDTAGIWSPEPTEARDKPPVHKTYTRPHTFKEIF
jgi:hypothetical protein